MKHGIWIGIFLVASLLAGCGDSSADDLALTEAQNGETVALEPGDKFSVELSGNPTTGYEWTVVQIDAGFLRLEESSYDSDSSAIGSGGTYVFRFESLKVDHLRFDGISAHIFHGPKYSTRKRGGRFPLLLTRCGDHPPTADRSGAAARAAGFSGTGRRAREARFVRLASNDLRNGAPLRISEVGGGVGRSARAARPPRRAAGSAF